MCVCVCVCAWASNVKVVGFGKAVLGMVEALEGLLGEHIATGVASVPVGSVVYHTTRRKIRYI